MSGEAGQTHANPMCFSRLQVDSCLRRLLLISHQVDQRRATGDVTTGSPGAGRPSARVRAAATDLTILVYDLRRQKLPNPVLRERTRVSFGDAADLVHDRAGCAVAKLKASSSMKACWSGSSLPDTPSMVMISRLRANCQRQARVIPATVDQHGARTTCLLISALLRSP